MNEGSQNQYDKLIQALNYANSSTRNATLDSLIESSLFEYDDPVNDDELRRVIKTMFQIEIHEVEFKKRLKDLVSDGQLTFVSQCYSLSEERRSQLNEKNNDLKKQEGLRDRSLFNLIAKILHDEIAGTSDALINKIKSLFKGYITETFLEYGEKAARFFDPYQDFDEGGNLSTSEIFRKVVNDEPKDVTDQLKLVLERFPKFIGESELNYLYDLANKTMAFKSLGLSEDEFEKSKDLKFIEWVVFLDTNFLYSILDLHSNPESWAAKEVLKIIREYDLNIKLCYLPATLKELKRNKEKQFGEIPDDRFSKSHVKALLKSKMMLRLITTRLKSMQ